MELRKENKKKHEQFKILLKILWLFILSFFYVKYSTSDQSYD